VVWAACHLALVSGPHHRAGPLWHGLRGNETVVSIRNARFHASKTLVLTTTAFYSDRPNSALACDALNGETYTAMGSNKYLKIGYIGLMQGSWAKYSQGYCQILTVISLSAI